MMSNEQKAQAVLDVLSNRQTCEQAAATLGVEVADVEAWRVQLLSSLGKAFSAQKPQSNRRPWFAVGAAAAAMLFLFGVSTAVAAAVDCTSDGSNVLCVFSPNTPARSSEINSNFQKLQTWLESKVGSVDNSAITATNTVTIDNQTGDIAITGADQNGNLLIEADQGPLYLNHHSQNRTVVGGELYMGAGGNISNVGTVSTSALTATGNVSAGSFSTTGTATATGNVSAGSFSTTGTATVDGALTAGSVTSGGFYRVNTSPVVMDVTTCCGGGAGNCCPGGYTWVNVDLNQGAGGDYCYLCKWMP